MDHSMHQPVELTAPAQEAPEPQDLHAGHQMPPAEPVEQEREQPVDHSMHAPAEQAQPAPEAADAPVDPHAGHDMAPRSEEHTSELQSLMRISYAVFCLQKKKKIQIQHRTK